MPLRLDYATPEVNRKSSAIDRIPFVLGILQSLEGVLVLTTFFGGRGWPHGFSNRWYEWPAQLWLSDTSLGLIYLLASVTVILGAINHRSSRTRYYRRYAAIWIMGVAMTELALLVLSPWPGERRYRWVLLHNFKGQFVDPEDFWNYPYGFALANPALVFLAARSVARKFEEKLRMPN